MEIPKYQNKKGNSVQNLHVGIISGSLCFLIGVALTSSFWWLSVILLIFILCYVVHQKTWIVNIMTDEMKLIQYFDETQREILEEEHKRIEKAMKLDEKREKIADKELKAQTKKADQMKRKQEIEDRKLALLELKYQNELEKLNSKSNTLQNLFDTSAQSILRPIIRTAKKENRQISGQELIGTILKGMK